MNFKEAIDFKEKNSSVTGTFSTFLNNTIECLVIAPDDIIEPNITLIYNQMIAGESNETALQNLGFYNGTMNVYVIWQPAKAQLEQMALSVYLSAQKT